MIFIDILKKEYLKHPANKAYITKGDLSESVNFIKYVKHKYDIDVSQLARIFNVSRQSIYNYFNMSTDQLPKVVITKIIYIYGFHSFEEVLEMELILFFENFFIDDIEGQIESGISFDQVNHKFKYLYMPNKNKKSFNYILLKKEFSYKESWKRKLNNLHNTSYIESELYNEFRKFVSKHSHDYLKLFYKKINEFDNNDYEIINILNNYLNRKRR